MLQAPRQNGRVADFADVCAAMFGRHRVAAFDGVFHVPDVDTYPALFAWDSGYHALSTRHLDPDLAAGELTTLYRSNTLPDGLLSHQRFVPGAEGAQRMIEELFGPMFDGDRTPLVDPPTAAYAAARLARAGGPEARHLLDAALGHLRAVQALRCLEGGALPVALHPFETGTEGNVFMLALVGDSPGSSLARLKDLTVSARAAGMSPRRALTAGHPFVVHDPTVCGWYLLALEEVARACDAPNRAADRAWAESSAVAAADAMESLLWSEQDHLFAAYDLAGPRRLGGIGAMGLLPAASRCFAERGIAESVASHHLGEGAPMWGPRGFAAGTVRPGAGVRSFVQWDGNAVWGATAYWAHLLAVRTGRADVAWRLRTELEALISSHGFREFYDAWTGEPGGAGERGGFTWPALVLEMAANERSLPGSRG